MKVTGTRQNLSPVERVLQSALMYPDRPALELRDAKYSYKELIQAAATISDSIISLNDPCPFIAVMADKSFSCYAGILGALMAGKAYLPVNPRFPATRNQFMLEKARVRIILENGQIKQLSPSSPCPPVTLSPAYLLFTSGTTGKPKGVPVSLRNLASYLDFMQKTYDFKPEDRFTQNFDLTFDLSVHDIFLAWSSGACLCVPHDNSSFAMTRFIRENKPTVWFSVPSVIILMDRMRLLKPGAFPSIRLSFFCGEALPLSSAKVWKQAASQSSLVNLYGPTEATIAVSHYELPDDIEQWKSELRIISIGKVFEGNTFQLIGGTSQVTCEVGPAELCLSGSQVVDGYFENEQADREAFYTEAATQQKWYKTGDIVKLDNDGDLFYLGRKDAEIKISGYRVNLKEIESALAEYETIEQAVVIFENRAHGQGVILAFILARKPGEIKEMELDEFCRQQLPWYMVPGKFIFVEEIPLNLNGKVDVATLKNKYINGN